MAVVINGNGTVTGISVGGLPDGIVDSGTLATNSVDSAELVDGAVDDSHMASISGRKNLIINGAMNVHQRGGTTTSEEYVLDRFRLGRAGGTRTASQEVITSGDAFDAGFRNSFRITNTTAGSTTATDYAEIQHHIESQNIATSGWNYTDSAKDITLSFWAKSSVGQTFNLFIKNDDTGYRYTSTFTLTANTWTRITKTLSGDSNLVLNNDNGKGLLVSWQVYQGTNWTTSTPNNDTWKASGNPDDMTTTWNTTTGATFDLTGVQVELGSTATDFEHRSYGEELALCQRFYCKSYSEGDVAGTVTDEGKLNMYTMNISGGWWQCINIKYPVNMRTIPTVTTYSPSSGDTGKWMTQNNGGGEKSSNLSYGSTIGVLVAANGQTCISGDYWSIHYTADAEL